jgi:hypothetical protein
MIIACEVPTCVRGLVHRAGGWADPCQFCGGLGGITLAELCRRINEHESTVARIFKPDRRMRARTAARILDKLLEELAR